MTCTDWIAYKRVNLTCPKDKPVMDSWKRRPRWDVDQGTCCLNACDKPGLSLPNFKDRYGNSCEDYRTKQLCTQTGEYGTGWNWDEWAPSEDIQVQGRLVQSVYTEHYQ